MPKLSALIVDDEPLARERIRDLLTVDSDFGTVWQCADGLEACAAIREHAPDIIFLDVQMPELDGFGVLEKMEGAYKPAVILVSAYSEHALRGFEVNAIDYLLKPFDRERFDKAVARAKEHVRNLPVEKFSDRLLALLGDSPAPSKWMDRLAVRSDGRTLFVRVEDIDWVEGSGNYIRLHAGAKTPMVRETMNGIEGKLNPTRFVRIHRSTIVNVDRIEELEPWFHGDHVVVLRNGAKLTLSRRYRDRMEAVLGRQL